MLNTILQLVAIHLFAALPWFASWIANDGTIKDLWMPIIGTLVLGAIFSLLLLL